MKNIYRRRLGYIMSLIILCIAVLMVYYFRPHYVKLELVDKITGVNFDSQFMEDDRETYWWFMNDFNENSKPISMGWYEPTTTKYLNYLYPGCLSEWGVDFEKLKINFDENNVILSFSREIKEMKFKRFESFPYYITNRVKTIMSNQFERNVIYIYKIPKYEVGEDLRARTETSIEVIK